MLKFKPCGMRITVFGINQKAAIGLGGVADILY
jgi:hypothetical protein